MGHKRKLTAHEKQVRFFIYLLSTLAILAVVALILILNRPVGGYH